MFSIMRFPIHQSITLLLTAVFAVATSRAAEDSAEKRQVVTAVSRLLEQGHYTREKLNDEMSAKFLESYLRMLDYNRLYFLQSDIDEFQKKYGTALDDALLRGDLEPAEAIYNRYKQRLEARIKSNLALIDKPHDFTSDRTVQINRQKAEWPKDQAEADQLWADRIEAELLQEQLSKSRVDSPVKILTRRYNQILRNINEQDQEDVLKTYLSALAQTYDPHSDYMSPSDMENFSISMRLSLVGVGAVLRSDEGYARVVEVVPGGPADRDGRLRVNDRISAVAQGSKDFEDVMDMKLDKVVEKIRGEKGSTVRLLVVPADATDPSKREVIDIVRDEVKLKEQEAKAEVIDLKGEDGRSYRMGWISLPSFYADMERTGGAKSKSTTEDVQRLLNRLNAEGIEGLIVDLRKDGGGSLEEAIRLTGLFIPAGPVVQAKDANGRVSVSRDDDNQVAYSGPMVVLMNRLSASASEIFAAALQDYGRAVIVGDERSFGKGTVQQVIDVGRFMPFFSLAAANAGSLKLTVQKFYRVKGGSTQLNGVESDVVLPSLTDTPEIGEGSMPNAMPYDEVAARPIDRFLGHSLYLDELRRRSQARIAEEPEFRYSQEDIDRVKKRIEENQISLNKARREAELAADKERTAARNAERKTRGPALNASAFELTLDTVDAPKLMPVAFDRKPKKSNYLDALDEAEEKKSDGSEEITTPDPIRNEALHIVEDLINLSGSKKTAKANS